MNDITMNWSYKSMRLWFRIMRKYEDNRVYEDYDDVEKRNRKEDDMYCLINKDDCMIIL